MSIWVCWSELLNHAPNQTLKWSSRSLIHHLLLDVNFPRCAFGFMSFPKFQQWKDVSNRIGAEWNIPKTSTLEWKTLVFMCRTGFDNNKLNSNLHLCLSLVTGSFEGCVDALQRPDKGSPVSEGTSEYSPWMFLLFLGWESYIGRILREPAYPKIHCITVMMVEGQHGKWLQRKRYLLSIWFLLTQTAV